MQLRQDASAPEDPAEVVGTWTARVHNGSLELSAALASMWGVPASEVGTTWRDVARHLGASVEAQLARLHEGVCAGASIPPQHLSLERADGTRRTFLIHGARPEPGPEGRYVGVVQDVSASAERERRDEVLRAQLESARDADLGTWEVSLVDHSLRLSSDLERAFGHTFANVAEFAEFARRAVHPSDQAAVADAIERVVVRGEPIGPLTFRVRDGTDGYQPFRHVGARLLTDAGGRAHSVVGVIQHFGWAHRRLERSERLLQRAVDSGGLGLWEWNPRTDEASYNAEWGEMVGYPFSELPADTSLWRELLHPQERDEVFAALRCEDSEGAHRVRLRFRMRRRDGSYAHIVCTALVTERDAEGRVTRVSGSNMDVSEFVEARVARERLETQLARAQRMESLGQLAGGVAHDFNNALQVISASCELAETGPPDEARRYLQEVREAAMSAAVLTRQLLTFSRQQPSVEARVDLRERMAGLVPMLARVLDRPYRLEVSGAEPVFASLDPCLLEQAVLNLVLNARDAMPGGGVIRLETDSETLHAGDPRLPPDFVAGAYTLLRVSDEGCGIAPEHLDEVFAPFFTTKEPGRGTGLGLAMVYGFAKQHRGFARVDSAPGQGACFELWFPRASQTLRPPRPESPVQPAHGRGENILVADDDPRVRRVLVKTLEMAGYHVLEAEDGAQAVRLFTQHHAEIALVVLDMVMPVMSGMEVLARMLPIAPPRGVLFVSGYLAGTLTEDVDAHVPVQLVAKPWRRDELLERVRMMLADAR